MPKHHTREGRRQPRRRPAPRAAPPGEQGEPSARLTPKNESENEKLALLTAATLSAIEHFRALLCSSPFRFGALIDAQMQDGIPADISCLLRCSCS